MATVEVGKIENDTIIRLLNAAADGGYQHECAYVLADLAENSATIESLSSKDGRVLFIPGDKETSLVVASPREGATVAADWDSADWPDDFRSAIIAWAESEDNPWRE